MPKLILFPGLVADERLFIEQKRALGDELLAVRLPTPLSKNETLTDYARRIAAELLPQTDEPYRVGGVSFGGQLALEFAKVAPRPPQEVLLISSCRTRADFPRLFYVNATLGRIIPDRLMPAWLSLMSGPFARREGLNAEHSAILKCMAQGVDVALLRWATDACLNWNAPLDAELPCPVRQVHGDRDWVIPPGDQRIDQLLSGAKHLLTFTHPGELKLIDPW